MSKTEGVVIEPTVGRIVYYHPASYEGHISKNGDEPLAAIVTTVNADRTVGLVVFDSAGLNLSRSEVKLVQGSPDLTLDECFCYWMPYQLKQAEKASEALNQQLKQPEIGCGVMPAPYDYRKELALGHAVNLTAQKLQVLGSTSPEAAAVLSLRESVSDLAESFYAFVK